MVTPNATSGFADFDKKSLTLFLAGLFVILSLAQIVWETRKAKRG
jgi:hypothetical protein